MLFSLKLSLRLKFFFPVTVFVVENMKKSKSLSDPLSKNNYSKHFGIELYIILLCVCTFVLLLIRIMSILLLAFKIYLHECVPRMVRML